MSSPDNIKFEVLEDGQISITTDQVSGVNHVSADKLLKQIFDLAGGPVQVKKRTRLNVGATLHEHEGHFHTH